MIVFDFYGQVYFPVLIYLEMKEREKVWLVMWEKN